MSGWRKAERKWFVGSTGDVSKGKGGLHLIIHCSRRGETAGLRLLEYRKREEKVFGEPSWFSGGHQDLLSVSQYLTSVCTISASFPGSQRLNDAHLTCYGRVWGDHGSTGGSNPISVASAPASLLTCVLSLTVYWLCPAGSESVKLDEWLD